MKKVVELLEQHCQWIAIGVGGIFLILILWNYVLTSPVAVEVPGQPSLQPGNVDLEVAKIAKNVEDQMNTTRLKIPPRNAQEDPLERHRTVMAGGADQQIAIANGHFTSSIAFNPTLKDPDKLPDAPQLVQKLPDLPPSEVLPNLGLKTARAQVVIGPVGEAQPAQPAPAVGAGAAPAVPANATDLNYARGEYRIEPAEIQKSFQEVGIPAGQTTMILAIKVVRQEQKPDGSWSEPVEVKPLDNGIRPWPLPGPNAGFQEIGQYEAWFASPQGQANLLRPPFYTVLSGEGPWDPPTTLDDAKAAVKAATESERLRQAEERRLQRESRPAPQPRQPASPTTPRRGVRPRDVPPEFGIEDSSRSESLAELAGLQLAQVAPPNYPGGRYPPPFMPPSEMDEFSPAQSENWPQMSGQQVQPGTGQPQLPPLPQAQFDPRQTPTIYGWFFDTEVAEGRTYRYQVLYAIKNPVWQSNLVARDKPELARQYAIWSTIQEDAWSEPRTVETTTRYFIADRSWTAGSVPASVRMEVFKWTGGKWQSRVFNVSPGDQIGWRDAGTDWGTNSRLVDVRFDERLERAYLLVMGPDGKIVQRDPFSDREDNNEERAALKFLVRQAQQPAVGTATGNPPAPVAGR